MYRRKACFPVIQRKLDNNKLVAEQKLLTQKLNLTVDLDRCTGCGVCIDACPEEAVSRGAIGAVNRGKAKVAKVDVDEKKCSFCGVCNIMCPFNAIKLSIDGKEKLPILEKEGFPTLVKNAKIDQDKCTRCVLCEEVCPRDAIKREVAKVDQGHKAASTMKYSIDYKLDEQKCTLCGICSEACDAFKIDFKEPTPLTVKKIGKLSFDEKKCDACKVCVEICPKDALAIERKIIQEPKLTGKVDINLDDCTTCSLVSADLPQRSGEGREGLRRRADGRRDQVPERLFHLRGRLPVQRAVPAVSRRSWPQARHVWPTTRTSACSAAPALTPVPQTAR